ncbi:hypothetical protein HPG69_010659 [Diceros bicornis minor]|uniref:Uncharacterized protein n=1 Tax=Diceros bicornis minor TaxID=77932 RepID=A0A7J7EWU1_DICBM|nr:hypothetical protein HPG69_010659 [Diceros bicornis minor]
MQLLHLRRPRVTLESPVFENRACDAVLKCPWKGGGEITCTAGHQCDQGLLRPRKGLSSVPRQLPVLIAQ